MNNISQNWISNAAKAGTLRACFVDCQKAELRGMEDTTPFFTARDLAIGLRTQNIPLSHFIYDYEGHTPLKPFQYKNKKDIPRLSDDFAVVIPAPEEWVYPKDAANGFENSHAKQIVQSTDESPEIVLICAGFLSDVCLSDTAIGSFSATSNPSRLKIILVTDATNLETPLDQYTNFVREVLAPEHVKDNISFATTQEVLNAINTPVPAVA